MMSENEFMPIVIRPVSRKVNTRRIARIGILGDMAGEDDLEYELRMARARRLRAYRIAAGWASSDVAAKRFHWVASTLRSHENGNRTIGTDDAERYARAFSKPGKKVTAQDILFGPPQDTIETVETGTSRVPVVGLIGAGGDVEPEYEQIPPEGLYQVDLPLTVPEGIVAFQVSGDSMISRFRDGDVILVWREQKRPLESFYGEDAAVRTSDGHRYVKTILYGKSRSVVNLQSLNAPMIEGVRLEWIGEIYLIIPANQVHRSHRGTKAAKDTRRRPETGKSPNK